MTECLWERVEDGGREGRKSGLVLSGEMEKLGD